MSEINAGQQNLNNVFSNAYFFEIPTYQRPYSWGTEQVGELLDDLLHAMDRGDQEPYFLGSIVLIKGEMEPDSEVIDGQQRLTTLSMLLCVLREIASESIRKGLDDRIRQAGDPLLGTPDRFRVNLRMLDRRFFQDNVQTPGALEQLLKMEKSTFETDSQKQIFENVNYLNDRLSDLDESTRQALARYIIQYCYLVVVTTEDKGSAFRIFSVLNDRGLSLTPTDILKADVIGAMETPEEEREYGDKWEEIEQELGRDDFQSLFVHLRVVYLQARPRRSLQDDFQGEILPKIPAKKFMDEVLPQYADAYEEVSRASYEGNEVVNKYLRHLRRVGNADWIPPTIAFFRLYRRYPDIILQFTKDLERLAYGLYIRGANINERTGRYVAILRDIEDGNDTLWREDGPLQLNSDEKNRVLNILDGPMYNRTILLRLDSLLADAGAIYDHPVISVEHVLPQNPSEGSQWMKWFPDAEEREQWTHRLANLVLLSRRRNYRASNHEFERKKSEYFLQGGTTTTFALTSQVLSEQKWTPNVLKRRQTELIDALKKEWRLD